MDTRCAIGRYMTRNDPLGGLDWQTPCPVPAETSLPFKPEPLWFCTRHFDALEDEIYPLFLAAGLLDTSIVGGQPDAFDELVEEQGLFSREE